MRQQTFGQNPRFFHSWLPEADLRLISATQVELLENQCFSPGAPLGSAVNVIWMTYDHLSITPRGIHQPQSFCRVALFEIPFFGGLMLA
jgi:hypothetical protein